MNAPQNTFEHYADVPFRFVWDADTPFGKFIASMDNEERAAYAREAVANRFAQFPSVVEGRAPIVVIEVMSAGSLEQTGG